MNYIIYNIQILNDIDCRVKDSSDYCKFIIGNSNILAFNKIDKNERIIPAIYHYTKFSMVDYTKEAFIYSFFRCIETDSYDVMRKYGNTTDNVNNLCSYYSDIANKIKNELTLKLNTNIEVLCSVGGCDFIILYEDKKTNALLTREYCSSIIESLLQKPNTQYMNVIETEKSDNLKRKKSALSRDYWSNTHNPRSYKYKEIYKYISESALDTVCKEKAYTLFMLLIKKSEIQIASVRWMSYSGEYYLDIPGQKEYYDTQEERYIKYINDFINKTQTNNICNKWSWMYYFFYMNIRDSLLEKSKESWKKDNFWGIYPIIYTLEDESENDISSPKIWSDGIMNISPDYSFEFLFIPSDYTMYFWEYFPTCIHEFYHYIPSSYRDKRNRIMIILTMSNLLFPLYNRIKQIKTDTRIYLDLYYNTLYSFIDMFIPKELFEINSKEKPFNDIKFYDSRTIYAMLQKAHADADFISLYKDSLSLALTKTHDVTEDHKIRFSSEAECVINECLSVWDDTFLVNLRKYNRMLREVRSDLAMCYVLNNGDDRYNFGFKEYIKHIINFDKLMGIEKDENMSESTILRIGVVARALTDNLTVSGKAWLEICNKAIDEIIEEIADNTSSEAGRALNLKNYLIKYNNDYSIDCKDNSDGIFMEELLIGIITLWQNEYKDDIEKSILLKHSASMYGHHMSLSKIDALVDNIENCLYFSDLFSYLNN